MKGEDDKRDPDADQLVAAQAIRADRSTEDGATRVYLLAGLVRCRLYRSVRGVVDTAQGWARV